MKKYPNFDIREFVPKSIFDKYGANSTWFINEKVIALAQFYKDFFTKYYKNKNDAVKNILIVVNNWHSGGTLQQRGFRPPESETGAGLSQHRFCNAFDCDIIIVFKDDTRKEADYTEIHKIINEYNDMFLEAGLTTVESPEDAPTWLHSDCRWIEGQTKILTVRY